MKLEDTILERIVAADNTLETKRTLWNEYEQLFNSQIEDSVSSGTKSQVFDNKLGTFVLEREYRVMSQLMVGKVKGISKNDEGASKLMNLILDKYVIPNANAQFDFLTKCRLMDRYSNIYGNMFALVDWDVRKNGYIGPDMWLLAIRDVFPQIGAISLEDSDYIIIRTWQPKTFFEGLGKKDGYKNVSSINEKLSKMTGDKENREDKDVSERESNQYPSLTEANESGFFQVYTMFEKDRWVDYVPSAHEILRDGKNPHDNDELPIVNKYSIPMLDDYMGYGDFERGKTLQKANNSLWNLYLDAVKMSIFPPVLLNKDNIANMSSIKMIPSAKWLVRNQIGNVAQPLQLNPQGIPTFQSTYQVLGSAMLNLFGTSTTQTTEGTDPGFGKTPQALSMQSARELARDSADRFYMEQFLTKVMKKFTNLLVKKQSGDLSVRMFKPEIEELARSYPEVKKMWDEKTGKLSIKKSIVGSTLYDYEIIPGSTYMVDQRKQQENLSMMLEVFLKNPQLIETLRAEGKNVKLGELFTRILRNSGIQDFDKIIQDQTDDEQVSGVLNQDAQQFQNMITQMGISQVPIQPNGQNQAPTMPQNGQNMGTPMDMPPQPQPMQRGMNENINQA